MRKTFSLILILAIPALSLAGDDPGTTGAQFLRIGMGARACAMGEAFTGVADDIESLFWNPAGLANFAHREAQFMHNAWAPDTYVEVLNYAHPIKGVGTLAAGLTYLWMPGIAITSSDNPDGTGETFAVSDLAYMLGHGFSATPEVLLGWTAKGILRKLGSASSSGFAADLGVLYKPSVFPQLTAGLSVLGLGPAMKFMAAEEKMPMTTRGGVSWRWINEPDHRVITAVDAVFPSELQGYASLGGEYWYKETIALRVGTLAKPDVPSMTLGLGLKDFEDDFTAGLDYAYTWMNAKGVAGIHRISLSCQF